MMTRSTGDALFWHQKHRQLVVLRSTWFLVCFNLCTATHGWVWLHRPVTRWDRDQPCRMPAQSKKHEAVALVEAYFHGKPGRPRQRDREREGGVGVYLELSCARIDCTVTILSSASHRLLTWDISHSSWSRRRWLWWQHLLLQSFVLHSFLWAV